MAVNRSDNYGQWSDLPIKKDMTYLCSHCNCIVTHQCTIYTDVEYRVCTKCGERTKWTAESKELRLAELKHDDDRWKLDLDFKRNDPRKYRPRGLNG